MSTSVPRALLEVRYYQAAQEYLRNLPPEHFMESTPQAYQREIFLASMALMHARRADVHYFNELLVQYPRPETRKPGQVVPDNMIVVHEDPIKAEGSFDVPLQPVGPFWVLEYVSKNNRRKDYEESMHKYEHELKVPYYLLFVPEEEELTLYHHTGERYVTIKPNPKGLYSIPELNLELGLLAGWVRYWLEGELLPLPGELQRDLDQARLQLGEAERNADKEHTGRLAAEHELARLREEIARLKQPPNGTPPS